MDYIFCIHSINFVHKSLHYWTKDFFKNNRRSLLMKTKSKINLFATALLTSAILGSAHSVFADSQIVRHTENDSIEIISDPYKTFAEADKALNEVKDKYLEEYGNYRAGVIPTEDLKNYEVYAIIHAVSRDEHSKSTTQNVAKFLTNGQSSTPAKPVEEGKLVTPTKPAEDVKPETPTNPVEEVKPVTPAKPVEEVKPVTPTKPVEDIKPETPTKPVEDVKPETPTNPVEEVKPVTPAKPVEEVKPVTPTKPVEDIKPETPTKPVEEVKPVTPTKPVEEVKPETPAKPENNKNNDKKTLPNTGESTSILGIIGSVLSITGLGFIVKRKRG